MSLRERLRVAVSRNIGIFSPGRRLRQQLALETLTKLDGRSLRFLDAGCQEGRLARDVCRAHPSWRVVGVDIDEDSLHSARKWIAQEGLRAAFSRADITRFIGYQIYDAVAALECLAEITDDEAATRNLAEALVHGGILVAHVLDASWRPILRGSRRDWEREVRRGYRREEIISLLERAGLEVVRVVATTRGLAQLAGDVAQRFEGSSNRTKALVMPLMASAVRLDRAGITWGPARGLFIEARRP